MPLTVHLTQYDPVTSGENVGVGVVGPVKFAVLPSGTSSRVQEYDSPELAGLVSERVTVSLITKSSLPTPPVPAPDEEPVLSMIGTAILLPYYTGSRLKSVLSLSKIFLRSAKNPAERVGYSEELT